MNAKNMYLLSIAARSALVGVVLGILYTQVVETEMQRMIKLGEGSIERMNIKMNEELSKFKHGM